MRKWLLTIRPASIEFDIQPIRGHGAFLNSYAEEDEGLYDDHPITQSDAKEILRVWGLHIKPKF